MDSLLDPAFVWDGKSSDLAQQFYRAHLNLTATKQELPMAMSFTTEDLPDEIQSRLASLEMRFEYLPSLLQRALIWDSGFVYGNGLDLLRVYTSENRSMAQLAIPAKTFHKVGCAALNCSSQLRSQYCSGKQMLSISNCVTEDVQNQLTHTAMWATGSGHSANANTNESSNPIVIPEINLLRHQWVDTDANSKVVSYLVYAIHTVPEARQPAWGTCMAGNQATGLTVPCGVYRAQANKTKWQRPPHSTLVTQWLQLAKKENQTNSDSSSDGNNSPWSASIVTASAVGGVVVLIAVIVAWWCLCKRRKSRSRSNTGYNPDLDGDGSGDGHFSAAKGTPGAASNGATDTFHSSWTRPPSSNPKNSQNSSQSQSLDSADDGSVTMNNSALRALVSDPNLAGKRLIFEQIQFQKQISKGAFGEVWLANYQTTQVAVKRVRQDKKPKFQDLEEFTAEIQLTASLDHHHLVQFIGMAWMSLDTLCMVTEYMANGDLQGYLHTHMDPLAGFWTSEKTAIALGVAKALQYLHSQNPPLIHRDVKAKNVLLDEQLSPRLMDFGVSRRRNVDLTMTAGVGTPFWTAPEIIEGVQYSESSDLYSFGVLLTELETCQVPYHNQTSRQDLQYDPSTGSSSSSKTTGGGGAGTGGGGGQDTNTPVPAALRPFLILNLVMNGSLRPSFSEKCPEWLQELGGACLRRDPTKRPTAKHIAEVLARQWSMME